MIKRTFFAYWVNYVVKAYLAILIIAAGMASTAVLAGLYHAFPGDQWALGELLHLRTGWLDDAMVLVSALGGGGTGLGLGLPWVPILSVAGMLGLRRWADAAFLAVSTLAPVVNLGLKELVERPRPDTDLWLVTETGFAFPSGHSVFAASFLGALIWIIGRPGTPDSRRTVRQAAQAVLLLLILAVGFSRVYLGAHWPSDVIGGFLFGGLYLLLLVSVRHWLERRRTAAA